MASMDSYEYRSMTWPEVRAAARDGRVVVIPAGTLEDHGLHLPVDTDVVIAEGICRATAERIPENVVLLPPIIHGFSPHHLDFPGTISIDYHTFIEWNRDITRSLARHGFRKFLFVNGHGSNRPVLDLSARMTIVESPDVHCGAISWWELSSVREIGGQVLDTGMVAHACEAETSIYLALDPEKVDMHQARREVPERVSPHFWLDLLDNRPPGARNPVHMTEYWSTVTGNGVMGDPTTATAEKGRALIEAASAELAEIILELQERPIVPRVQH
jgi:creatinine amidohydrolase